MFIWAVQSFMKIIFSVRKIRICFIAGILFQSLPLLYAQKVALVLSGGGARGTAHVGVIKALEEHQIPIDYIAGTSIGALVGAMYAAGYSPEEMEEFFTSPELQRWSTGEMKSDSYYFFREWDPDASWVSMDFDAGKPITRIFPTSLINSTEMDFTLMKLFAGAAAAADYNFDNLFVPFRCVAADIDQSQPVVLDTGDLASAVRASITFPLFFKPITIDNKLLFDGGMYNNFPQDIAEKTFQPDFIIGSKVSGNYPSPDPNDIVTQLQKMLMTDTDFTIDISKGILIEPPVGKTGLTDFHTAATLIKAGYEETLKIIPMLREKIHRVAPSDSLRLKRENFRKKITPYFIDSVKAEGFNNHEARYVRNILLHKYKLVTIQEIEKGFYRIISDGYLESGMPTLTHNKASGNYLFDGDLSKSERFTLKFGGNISSRLANTGFVEIGYKYLFMHGLRLRSNIYFGRFYSSLLLGSRIETTYRKPLSLEATLVYNHFDYFRSRVYFVEDLTPSYIVENDHYGRIAGATPTDPKSRVELSFSGGDLDYRYYQSNIFHREDTADLTRFRYINSCVRWEHNSLNRKQYPSSGSRFVGELSYVSGKEKFKSGSLSNSEDDLLDPVSHQWLRLRISWLNYFFRSGPLRAGFFAETSLSTQGFFSNYTSTLLSAPAFQVIPESRSIFLPNFRAHNYSVAGFVWITEIRRNLEIRLEHYLFQPYRSILRDENNKAYYSQPFERRFWTGAASIVMHSFFGPISLSANYFDNPDDQFYFALNIGYLIFNRRALE